MVSQRNLDNPHTTRFCRATDQIAYDMKRRVIAEDRGICLKSGPLRSTLSHYTTNYSRLCFPGVIRNLSEIFEHVENKKNTRDPVVSHQTYRVKTYHLSAFNEGGLLTENSNEGGFLFIMKLKNVLMPTLTCETTI